uniref:Uncharacterized protein n=1 Tax=viral metagenome TaxID=1070528 RepID=A0A6H1ZRV5_9ZZZZ
MKGKLVKSVNPLIGALGTLEMMKDQVLGKDVSGRDEALNDELDGIVVDTCCPSDTGIWETGIRREKLEGIWVIVSQYDSKEEAEKAHKKWVKLMRTDPTCKLQDINMWNLKS